MVPAIERIIQDMEYEEQRSKLSDNARLARDMFRVNDNKVKRYLEEHPELKEVIHGRVEYSTPYLATRKKKE